MRSEPLVDALKVESMEAQRKRPHVISFLELQQTNGAVHGGGSFPHRGGRRKALPGASGGGVEKQRQRFDDGLV